MELAYKTALVTGGTAGIGLACARLLAHEGASVRCLTRPFRKQSDEGTAEVQMGRHRPAHRAGVLGYSPTHA